MTPQGEHIRGTRLLRSGLLGSLLLAAAALAACTGPETGPPPVVAVTPAALPPAPPPEPAQKTPIFTQTGLASWYGSDFRARRTASGERYDMFDLTAAHRTLPLDTMVKVTNLTNNRSVLVRINDRGPFAPGRVIDLSRGAAGLLGMVKAGVVPVRIEVFANDQFQTVAQYLDRR
ncbi:MAG TPA: septal ring lytic transglycosylase RlpA family protein [Stellaceae bacterium]|jgi:rare lipoprotein A|nr:septal ring lytic transglycosylase RlpA family protein [Stellaceae bacterium]